MLKRYIFYYVGFSVNINSVLGEFHVYVHIYVYTCVYIHIRISAHIYLLIPLGTYMGLIASNSKQQIFNSATDVAV